MRPLASLVQQQVQLQVSWRAGEEVAVAVAVLELFHLLPRSAISFLEPHGTRPGLIAVVWELEERLAPLVTLHGSALPQPRLLDSPYRGPLVRYLNRYAPEAAAYFLDGQRLGDPALVGRLVSMLKAPDARPLLLELSAAHEKLRQALAIVPLAAAGAGAGSGAAAGAGAGVAAAAVPGTAGAMQVPGSAVPGAPPGMIPAGAAPGAAATAAAGAVPGQGAAGGAGDAAAALGVAVAGTSGPSAVQFHAVRLVAVISKLLPGWLSSQPELFAAVMERWRCPTRAARLAQEDQLPRDQLLESKRLARCVLDYCSGRRSEVSPLLELFSVFSQRTTVDFSFVERYCQRTIAEQYSPLEKRGVLWEFVGLYRRFQQQQAQAAAAAAAAAVLAPDPTAAAAAAAAASPPVPSSAAPGGPVVKEAVERMLAGLVNPLLASSLEKGQLAVLDQPLVDALVRLYLDTGGDDASAAAATAQTPAAGAGAGALSLASPRAGQAGGLTSAASGGTAGPSASSSATLLAGPPCDSLAIEMLQLGTLLFKFAPAELLKEHRKKLINFGWHYLRNKDISASYALLNVAYYLKSFQSPDKIIHQVGPGGRLLLVACWRAAASGGLLLLAACCYLGGEGGVSDRFVLGAC